VLDCRLEAVGIHSNCPHYFVFIATPTRLFASFAQGSISSLKSLGDPVSYSPERIPSSIASSSSLKLWSTREGKRPDRFAWLRSDGVLIGSLSLSTSSPSSPIATPNRVISLPNHDAQLTGSFPVSISISEFHVLLLYEHDGLHALNMLSGEGVESLPQRHLGGYGTRSVCLAENLDASGSASGGRYIVTSAGGVLEVGVKDEARDIWWLHVERGEYARALELARNQEQRERVHLAQAESALQKNETSRAAALFARAGSSAPFESISLRLLHDHNALKVFLLHKLDRLGPNERAQATMLATWLAELYLEDNVGSSSGSASDEFRSFLEDHKHELDGATTRQLLAEHGLEDELVLFASLIGDHETVITHHIGRYDVERAIAAMRKPGVPASLKYRHAPNLVELDPTKAIDFFISAGSSFDARLLLPSLTRTSSDSKAQLVQAEAIRLLEHWIGRALPGSSDSSVRNFLITLHAQRGDERSVLQCIESPLFSGALQSDDHDDQQGASDAPPRPLPPQVDLDDSNAIVSPPSFDKEHALRACLENNCTIAAVSLYASLGAYEEAVELALSVDSSLAKQIADKPEGDDTLRRSLWLQIARAAIGTATSDEHYHDDDDQNDTSQEQETQQPPHSQSIYKQSRKQRQKQKRRKQQQQQQQQQQTDADQNDAGVSKPSASSVREAVAVLEEANGLLRVEDVLPLFPDFTRVGDFKQAVVHSLEQYNQQIEGLRQEIKDATSTADSIRADIERLRRRKVTLSRAEPCWSCGEAVINFASEGAFPAFFAFPCGMAFHSGCLVRMLQHEMGSQQKQQATTLLKESKEGSENAEAELERLIAHECPLCGDRAIHGITEPFVRLDDPEVDLWRFENTVGSRTQGSPPRSSRMHAQHDGSSKRSAHAR
jgi:hypothetical protein